MWSLSKSCHRRFQLSSTPTPPVSTQMKLRFSQTCGKPKLQTLIRLLRNQRGTTQTLQTGFIQSDSYTAFTDSDSGVWEVFPRWTSPQKAGIFISRLCRLFPPVFSGSLVRLSADFLRLPVGPLGCVSSLAATASQMSNTLSTSQAARLIKHPTFPINGFSVPGWSQSRCSFTDFWVLARRCIPVSWAAWEEC